MKENDVEELQEYYAALKEKYNTDHEFAYCMIKLSVKLLMDIAPRHGVALETIRIATEEGIKWHVQERASKKKKEDHE